MAEIQITSITEGEIKKVQEACLAIGNCMGTKVECYPIKVLNITWNV